MDGVEFQSGFPFGEDGLLFADPAGKGGVVRRCQLQLQGRDAVGQGGLVEGFKDGLLVDGRARVVAGITVQASVAQRIEVGEHLEVILLADRVELVVMALRTSEGEAEHRLAQGLHAVGVVVDEVLRGDGAALVCVHVVPLETGRDELGVGRVRQEVTGQLLQDELVVGQVVVEGLDHPVAPEPHVAAAVDGEAVGVGVTGGVQPLERHAFAKVRASQQASDELGIGLGVAVSDEGLDLFGGGRQAREVEGYATDQRGAIGASGGLKPLLLQRRRDECIDGVAGGGRRRFLGHREGPVGFVFRALLNPGLQRRLVLRTQLEVRLRRGHDVIGVVADDALPDFALGKVTWDDRGAAFMFTGGFFREVEPELGLA